MNESSCYFNRDAQEKPDRANTRFAPTSAAGLGAAVVANLVFARSWNAKIRIAGEVRINLTIPPPGIIIFFKSKPGGNHMIKKKLLTTMIFVALITLNLNGLFVFNETEGAFNLNPCESCEDYAAPTLGQLIVTGAGYFIHSNSDYQLFLETVEMSGIYGMNNEDTANKIDHAIKNMEMANETYYRILQVSNLLEYNPTILEKLKQAAGRDDVKYSLPARTEEFRPVDVDLPGSANGEYQFCVYTCLQKGLEAGVLGEIHTHSQFHPGA